MFSNIWRYFQPRPAQPPPCTSPCFYRGFTLIEVLIVLAILASLISIGLPRVLPKKTNLKKTIRHLRVLSKEVRNRARLQDRIYRLAFQMDEKRGFLYWVEKANQEGLGVLQTLKYEKENKKKQSEEEKAKVQAKLFTKASKLMKKPKSLPKGVVFFRLEKRGKPPEKTGIAYIHFFPSGRVEEKAVYIGKPDTFIWTLFTHPLTGEMRIVSEEKKLEDLFPAP